MPVCGPVSGVQISVYVNGQFGNVTDGSTHTVLSQLLRADGRECITRTAASGVRMLLRQFGGSFIADDITCRQVNASWSTVLKVEEAPNACQG